MSKDYKAYTSSPKKSGSSSSSPKRKSRAWLWLLFVGAIIIIIIGMVWLSHQRQNKVDIANAPKPLLPAKGMIKPAPAPVAPKPVEKPKIQFEFYNLLTKETVPPVAAENSPMPATVPKVKTAAPVINATPVITAPTPSSTNPANRGTYMLQIASVKSINDANALKAKLSINGYPVQVKQITISGATWYRVWVGPFDSIDAATTAQTNLRQQNINGLLRKS